MLCLQKGHVITVIGLYVRLRAPHLTVTIVESWCAVICSKNTKSVGSPTSRAQPRSSCVNLGDFVKICVIMSDCINSAGKAWRASKLLRVSQPPDLRLLKSRRKSNSYQPFSTTRVFSSPTCRCAPLWGVRLLVRIMCIGSFNFTKPTLDADANRPCPREQCEE